MTPETLAGTRIPPSYTPPAPNTAGDSYSIISCYVRWTRGPSGKHASPHCNAACWNSFLTPVISSTLLMLHDRMQSRLQCSIEKGQAAFPGVGMEGVTNAYLEPSCNCSTGAILMMSRVPPIISVYVLSPAQSSEGEDLAGTISKRAEVAGEHIALQLVGRLDSGAFCPIHSLPCLIHACDRPLHDSSAARQAAVAPRPNLRTRDSLRYYINMKVYFLNDSFLNEGKAGVGSKFCVSAAA